MIAYASLSDFKLYVLDVGLLSAMGNLSAATILEEKAIFKEFKGTMLE